MKRYLFVILLLFGVSTAVSYGQTHYRVTGNNVNVREGAGKNYPVQDDGYGHKVQLYKGQIVMGDKKKTGSFLYGSKDNTSGKAGFRLSF